MAKAEWRLDCLKCEYKNTKADVDKYKQTLQEIKKYMAKVCKEECGYVQKRDVLIVIVDSGRF